jgi:hypothetical protein
LIPLYGLAVLLSASAFVFFEDLKQRVKSIQVLIVLLIIDSFILHNPIIENYEMRSLEIKHLVLDFLIIFSLLMVAGYRE